MNQENIIINQTKIKIKECFINSEIDICFRGIVELRDGRKNKFSYEKKIARIDFENYGFEIPSECYEYIHEKLDDILNEFIRKNSVQSRVKEDSVFKIESRKMHYNQIIEGIEKEIYFLWNKERLLSQSGMNELAEQKNNQFWKLHLLTRAISE